TVRIEGEVLFPGSYTISRKDERITDLIQRAGGLTPFAYINGASLKRPGNSVLRDGASRNDRVRAEMEAQTEKANLAMITNLQKDQENLSLSQSQIQQKIQNDYVGVDFERIMEKSTDKANLILQNGDIIFIPKELQTVNVGGEVLSPVTAVYIPNKSLKYYVSQGGGFSEQALKKRTYVVYANGSAKSTSSFLGIR